MLSAIWHLDRGQFGDGGYQEVHQDVNAGGNLIGYGPQGLRQGVGEEGVVIPVKYMVSLSGRGLGQAEAAGRIHFSSVDSRLQISKTCSPPPSSSWVSPILGMTHSPCAL